MGAIIAIASFTVTALYQIWIGKMVVGLDVSAPQLLLNQAMVSVPMLITIAPFFDAVPDLSKSVSFREPKLSGQTDRLKQQVESHAVWPGQFSGLVLWPAC